MALAKKCAVHERVDALVHIPERKTQRERKSRVRNDAGCMADVGNDSPKEPLEQHERCDDDERNSSDDDRATKYELQIKNAALQYGICDGKAACKGEGGGKHDKGLKRSPRVCEVREETVGHGHGYPAYG